jgi:DNA (cytosine-5)-methyltransferase 1
MGYHRAGFEVVGVDIEPQRNYPFEFHQADALEFLLDGFDAVHASPPCQLFTMYRNNHRQTYRPVLNLIPETRRRLVESGLPYVIENVPRAPLVHPIQLCGTSFPPLEVRRHRLFESNVKLNAPPCDHGRLTERKYPGSTNRPNGRTVCNVGEYRVPLTMQKDAMGVDWMTLGELSEAIPPPMTEWIGRQLLEHLSVSAGTRYPKVNDADGVA